MKQWNYDESTVKELEFEIIPVGEHRIRIADVVPTESKTGKDMLKITFDVSNHYSKLFYYLVFMEDNG